MSPALLTGGPSAPLPLPVLSSTVCYSRLLRAKEDPHPGLKGGGVSSLSVTWLWLYLEFACCLLGRYSKRLNIQTAGRVCCSDNPSSHGSSPLVGPPGLCLQMLVWIPDNLQPALASLNIFFFLFQTGSELLSGFLLQK